MSTLETQVPRTRRPAPTGPAPVGRRGGTTTALHRSERRWAALFITPVTLGFALFAVLPFVFSLYTAFTNWNPCCNDNHVAFFCKSTIFCNFCCHVKHFISRFWFFCYNWENTPS